MKVRIKDIIDLDYLVSIDEKTALENDTKLHAQKDREIYKKCSNALEDDQSLLMHWLSCRREEFYSQEKTGKIKMLPGSTFAKFYRCMIYIMIISGFITGVGLVYSYLAYYGIRPINVTAFISFFIIFQFILFVLTLLFLIKRVRFSDNSMVQAFIYFIFFTALPVLLKRFERPFSKEKQDTFEYTASLIKMKKSEYRAIFFWPFFMIPSFFAMGFSIGSFCGTMFRVAVSDMAFGWQSTLLTGSETVYKIVGFMSLAWSWFIPEMWAHPSLAQVEGTRIVLKESIAVLATENLVSWWPFLCLGIVFYAFLPRVLLVIAGTLAQKRILSNFEFKRSKFRKLLIRMRSPLMEIDFSESPVRDSLENSSDLLKTKKDNKRFKNGFEHSNAILLASEKIYSEDNINDIKIRLTKTHKLNITTVVNIDFLLESDQAGLEDLKVESSDYVLILHEAWQPPIKGVLYYFEQIKQRIFKDNIMVVFLTCNPLDDSLIINEDDVNFSVWKHALIKLENSDIEVERLT